jgi:nickel-dependent lactate racemase
MIYYSKIIEGEGFSIDELRSGLFAALVKVGVRRKVLIVPPDYTRYHSYAGILTSQAYEYFNDGVTGILPALGTHRAMTYTELEKMFHGIPGNLFRVHDWRKDVVTVGTISAEEVASITENTVHFSWPAQLNKLIVQGGHDLVLSIGQVVPHEVIGMANYNKNLFIGTGGSEGINKSHFIGAVYGMERLMGHADNPVRKLLNYASKHFIGGIPVVYVHTVTGKNKAGKIVVKGLFIGDDDEVFLQAAELSLKINFTMLDEPLKKIVVYLDASEFQSTWLGNKSIYRTRMALANDAEIIVLGPGIKKFGEDNQIDGLIRKYGYAGTSQTLKSTEENSDLQNNLSAAAHLIHGSSEGRFRITYCPGKLTRKEIESVGYNYASLDDMLIKYNPAKLVDGFNIVDREEIYYIANPALGLWAFKERFVC